MMMTPTAMAIAAITVMLWIMWSDTIRARRPHQILYAVRIALYLIMCGILVLNLVRNPQYYGNSGKILTGIAVIVGITGAIYFARRLTRRS